MLELSVQCDEHLVAMDHTYFFSANLARYSALSTVSSTLKPRSPDGGDGFRRELLSQN